MDHHGEIVRSRVSSSGITVVALANKLGISTRTLYNKFAEPTLKSDFILQVGRAINYNFSAEFPDLLKEYRTPGEMILEPKEKYTSQADYWKRKFIDLQNEFLKYQKETTQQLMDLQAAQNGILKKSLAEVVKAVQG